MFITIDISFVYFYVIFPHNTDKQYMSLIVFMWEILGIAPSLNILSSCPAQEKYFYEW